MGVLMLWKIGGGVPENTIGAIGCRTSDAINRAGASLVLLAAAGGLKALLASVARRLPRPVGQTSGG